MKEEKIYASGLTGCIWCVDNIKLAIFVPQFYVYTGYSLYIEEIKQGVPQDMEEFLKSVILSIWICQFLV